MKRVFKSIVLLPFIFFGGIVYLPHGISFADPDVHAIRPKTSAEAPPTELHLQELLEEAEEQNPDIRAALYTWKAARKKVLQSWALPDPIAGLDRMGGHTETRVGPQMHRFVVSQQIPFPLKLWEKRKAAKAAAQAEHERYLAVRRDVFNALKKTFYALYETEASLDVIHEIHKLLQNFESVAQARYASRSGGQRDVAKAQAEVSLTLEQVYLLEQKREIYSGLINTLIDRSPAEELGKAAKPEKTVVDKGLTEWISLAARNREEILEMEAVVNERKHKSKLARLEWIPDVNVGFSYTWVGEGTSTSPQDGQDSWMFPLRINVPLWQNRLIPAAQEANRGLEAARAKLEGSKNKAFYEVKDAYVRFETATKIAQLYETAVIPQAKLALSSDRAGYEAGEADFLHVLDSERVYLNAQLTYIRIYVEALKSYSDLVRSTGLDLMEA